MTGAFITDLLWMWSVTSVVFWCYEQVCFARTL